MKITCNIDAFRHLDKPFEYAVKALGELGYQGVEPQALDGRCILETYHYCPMISLDDDPIEIRKMVSGYGLEVSCLSAHTSLLETEFGVRYLRKAIKFAKNLGAPIVNTAEGPKPRGMTDEEAFAVMKQNLSAVMKTAENYGVFLTIEPHGEYTTNAPGLKKIMGLSKSKRLGINLDTGNVFLAGNDPVATLKAVVDRVMYMHVKDVGGVLLERRGKVTGAPVGVAVGKGQVDIKGCIDVLKKAGYDGWLSVEAKAEDLKNSLTYLKSIIQ